MTPEDESGGCDTFSAIHRWWDTFGEDGNKSRNF